MTIETKHVHTTNHPTSFVPMEKTFHDWWQKMHITYITKNNFVFDEQLNSFGAPSSKKNKLFHLGLYLDLTGPF